MPELSAYGFDRKIPVGVLGATGMVGQRMVTLLADHPWFDLVALTASDRSAGKRYADAVRWVQAAPIPERVAGMVVASTGPVDGCRLVFSALDASVAGEAEEACAAAGHLVVSNARNHRMEETVPLVVPEVNADHLALAARQTTPGAIITNPNCSTIGLVLALKPLHDAFGLRDVHVVTMQAVSGAGMPGVASVQIVDNVIPYIAGEEEKMALETPKVLGRLETAGITPAELTVSAQCNRVPVLDGHTECVAVRLERPATREALRAAWENFTGEPQRLALPSAPVQPIRYLEAADAPQPRLHRDLGNGMTVSVGRLQPCDVLDWKFVAVSHNTVRGAAGGTILIGELVVAQGLLDR